MRPDAEWLKDHVRDIPDFPKPGVVFKDITPLLGDQHAYAFAIDMIASHYDRESLDLVLGIEARGFIVAAPVAYRFRAGFVPVRKPGKLPGTIERQEYALEYGTDMLEIHRDAVKPGQRVLIVDDVLATGGTADGTVQLVERLGGTVAGLAFIIELGFLGGRQRLPGRDVFSLISYD